MGASVTLYRMVQGHLMGWVCWVEILDQSQLKNRTKIPLWSWQSCCVSSQLMCVGAEDSTACMQWDWTHSPYLCIVPWASMWNCCSAWKALPYTVWCCYIEQGIQAFFSKEKRDWIDNIPGEQDFHFVASELPVQHMHRCIIINRNSHQRISACKIPSIFVRFFEAVWLTAGALSIRWIGYWICSKSETFPVVQWTV